MPSFCRNNCLLVVFPRLCQELRTELSRQLFQLTQMLLTQTDAVFYKLHDSEHIRPDLELLWLPEDASLDCALLYRKETGVFGIALKNAAIQPRLALRFMSQDALQKFAAEKHIADLSRLGRWKLHGVPSYAGPVPVYAILEQRKWKAHEIFYFSPKHCVFLAESKGDDSPMCFAHGIHRKQLRFEAICVATITPCCYNTCSER